MITLYRHFSHDMLRGGQRVTSKSWKQMHICEEQWSWGHVGLDA